MGGPGFGREEQNGRDLRVRSHGDHQHGPYGSEWPHCRHPLAPRAEKRPVRLTGNVLRPAARVAHSYARDVATRSEAERSGVFCDGSGPGSPQDPLPRHDAFRVSSLALKLPWQF